MAPTYYVIELSPRWLTILLVALALVMVLAFAFGYGAAWSVLSASAPPPGGARPLVAAAATTTPTPAEQVIETVPEPTATVVPTSPPSLPRPTPSAVPTVAAEPTSPRAAPDEGEFWVQVLASSRRDNLGEAAEKLTGLGFGPEHREVITARVAGGNVLYKLRVGPFPDRDSADRVARRMRASGYPDAWVVTP